MKKLLALAFLLGSISVANAQAGPPPTGPAYSFPCNASVASSFITTANASQVVAPVLGKNIYVCGWHASTLTTITSAQTAFQLSFSGTTSNPGCNNTTSTYITPLNGVTPAAPSVDHGTVAAFSGPVPVGGLSSLTASPASLCLSVQSAGGAAANLQIIIYYGQY